MTSNPLKAIHRLLAGWGPVLAALLVFAAATARAADATDASSEGPGQEPISITADGFQANTDENWAEFSGNVDAVQGSFAILSDRLRIYYHSDADPGKTLALGNARIREIVATGNVRITADDRKALADKAVYTMDSQELVLSGNNATLSSRENRISGSKITFNRVTRRVNIEGQGTQRVSGTFFLNDQKTEASTNQAPDVVFLTPPPPRTKHPAQSALPPTVPAVPKASPETTTGRSEPPSSQVPGEAAAIDADATPPAPSRLLASRPRQQATEVADSSNAAAPGSTESHAEVSAGASIASQKPTSVLSAPVEPNAPPPPASGTAADGSPSRLSATLPADAPAPPAAESPLLPKKDETPTIGRSTAAEAFADRETQPDSPMVAAVRKQRLAGEAPVAHSIPSPAPDVPLKDLSKRVGMAVFENTSPVRGKGLETTLQRQVAETILREAPATELLRPDAPDYPPVFADLPRQASGLVNNALLVQTGRELGLSAVVTGSLNDIKIMTETTGFWRFKGSRVVARITAQVALFDTATGAKLLDEPLWRKIEMDEADLYAARQGRFPDISGIGDAVAEMGREAGEIVAEGISRQSWRGFITALGGDRVVISPGATAGLVAGNRLAVYDESPVTGYTGHLYFLPGRRIGEIQITAVSPSTAEGRIISGKSIREGLPVADPDAAWGGRDTGWRERLKIW